MATRDDVSVNWSVSPRLITVAAPSTEITIQDLHDTLRDLEDEPHNLVYPSIISSAGKEELGGGVSVGLTATLLDARLGFEARPDFFTQGTATAGTLTLILVDSGATFITDGVEIDDIVRNDTQNDFSTVISIDSETQLTLSPLTDGGSWTSGEDYTIWHVIQCNVSGGNLVALDANNLELNPIYPTGFTQVVRTSSSSATLQELADIQFASFDGAVHLDATSTYTGTTHPVGTPRQPVNNMTDARLIADERGIGAISVIGDYTFISGDDVSNLEVTGQSQKSSKLTFNSGSITNNVELRDATIEGTIESASLFFNCTLLDITDVSVGPIGTKNFRDCQFEGTITLSPSLQGEIHIVDCVSGVPGTNTPILDYNGANVDMMIRNYAGGIEIRNYSNVANNATSIDMSSGNVVLDSSNTTGTITIRGNSLLTDNTNGTIVRTSGLVFPNAIQESSFGEFVYLDTSSGTTGTKYPFGTVDNPVNNLADAQTIAADRKFYKILLKGTLIIGPADNIDGLLFKGITPATSIISLTSGCSTVGSQFEDITLTGVSGGHFICRRSGVQNVTNIGSDSLGTTFTECAFLDSVNPCLQLQSGLVTPKNLLITNCESYSTSGDGPVIDFNGSGTGFIVNNWQGLIDLRNITGGQDMQFDMQSGVVTIAATCTSGTIQFNGVGDIVDNSAGLTVDSNGLVHQSRTNRTWRNTNLIPGII